MNRLSLLVPRLIMAVAVTVTAHMQAQFAHTHGTAILGENGKPLQLRGLNLGNWMVTEGYMWKFDGKPLGPSSDREIHELVLNLLGPTQAATFWHTYLESYYSQEDMRRIQKMGFNSVRIPLHWRFFTPGNKEGFALLDRLVGWCRKEGLYVVLDLHAAKGGNTGGNMDDSDGWPWLYTDVEAQAATLDTWHRIAEHYRDDPIVLGYDLLNEPLPSFPQYRQFDSLLEPLYKRITDAIRSVDQRHIIIVGGGQWDTDFRVLGKPFDMNLVYEVHRYSVVPDEASLQPYLNFSRSNNVPLWMGEFGENTDVWTAAFVGLAEKNGIGWAFWPYKKMDAPSSPVTFPLPPHWDEIVAYAKADPNTGHIEDRIRVRPSPQHIHEAFTGLLENLRFDHEIVNRSCVDALVSH